MSSADTSLSRYATDTRGGSARMATFHLTTECNLRCEYCYALDNKNLDLEVWDARQAEPMISLLAQMGYRVSLAGGEPTFVPDRMFPLLELTRKHGVPCAVLTNGYLLDEKMLTDIHAQGCAWVQVSVDGRKHAEKLEPAFAIGKRLGLRMSAGSVLSCENFDDIRAIFDMLCRTGAAGWRILRRTSFAEHGPGANVPEPRWREAMMYIEELARSRAHPMQIRYEPGLVPLDWYLSLSAEDRPGECGARINKRLFVYPGGAVFSCGLPRNHAFFIGNYLTDYQRVRLRIAVTPQFTVFNRTDHPYCNNHCQGGCLQYRYGDSCDTRCKVDEGDISVCCYDKVPLDVNSPSQAHFLPSHVYRYSSAFSVGAGT